MSISDDFIKDYQPDPALLDPVIREMHMQNDRGAAIIAGVFLGEKLQAAIIEQWPPLSATSSNRLFEGYGPLNSFRARIDVAAAMGVLNVHSRSDFHKVRSLRNLAAHAGAPFSFDGELESKMIDEIECMKHMPPDEEKIVSEARNKFTGAVKMLLMYLFFQAHFKKRFGHLMVMPDFSGRAAKMRLTNPSSAA